MRDPELGRRRRGIEARDGGLPAAGGAFGSVPAAAAAPAEDDEDGDCYGDADSYAGYGAGGEEVVEDVGGVVWSWDWCCHYGVLIWSFLAFDFLPFFLSITADRCISPPISSQESKIPSRQEICSKL